VASYLLLIAAVGAVILARRRRGLEAEGDDGRLAAADLFRMPDGAGTQAESVGLLHERHEREEREQREGW
jgi:NADH-quinone oxidoreductase subunit J